MLIAHIHEGLNVYVGIFFCSGYFTVTGSGIDLATYVAVYGSLD